MGRLVVWGKPNVGVSALSLEGATENVGDGQNAATGSAPDIGNGRLQTRP
jgi:hypothetical protein